ncbi:MAG: hypothetical protein FJZ92_11925 [Chloroflexi bacterium]|nr:hypothetical protein [Chloroflexota bacterium]
MHLFRSEGHARRWARFDPAFEPRPLAFYLEMFGLENFRGRSRPDSMSWRASQPPPAPGR